MDINSTQENSEDAVNEPQHDVITNSDNIVSVDDQNTDNAPANEDKQPAANTEQIPNSRENNPTNVGVTTRGKDKRNAQNSQHTE